MSKFSVKKPLTIFVAVIAILVLGVVAYLKMTPDLLPNMDFPYVMIMTTYPGATPEKVENEITKPMEQSMSTLEHIKEVTSTSSENVSMVMLEFEESVNMDTIGVDIQQQISVLSAVWDDMVGTPYVLKINPSMLPVEVAGVSMEGMDTIALTEFLDDTLMNKLEGIPGVARISTTGAIEQELHVILDQKLIDKANQKVIDAINSELDDAKDELEEQKWDLEKAKRDMSNAQDQLDEGAEALLNSDELLAAEKEKLLATREELSTQLAQAKEGRGAVAEAYDSLSPLNEQVQSVVAAHQEAQNAYDTLMTSQEKKDIDDLKAQIEALEAEIEELKAGEGTDTPVETPPADEDPADPPDTPPEEPEDPVASPSVVTELPDTDSEVLPAEQVAFTASSGKTAVTVDLGYGVTGIVYVNEEAPSLMQVSQLSTETQIAQKEAELILLKEELAQKEEAFAAKQEAAAAQLKATGEAVAAMDAMLAGQGTDRATLNATVAELKTQLDTLDAGIAQLENALVQLDEGLLSVEDAEAMLEKKKFEGMLEISTAAGQLAAGSSTIEMALSQIKGGLDTLEDSREDALRQADLNKIITMDMVTQILTAQNFAMPAGYVEEEGVNYMVSIGDEITDLETLENLLLFDMGMEGVDPIYLKDVAVVMLTDNSDETYAKLDGNDGIMLSFEKQSTYATAETTNNIQERFRELEQEYPGLKFVALMNQGDYIYLIVDSIMNSLLLGAVFAVIILFLFLKDLRPTFITLCSIPISVIFAIVLMYFSGVTINMISLSGLAVAVGMLVDNSVVVIENIYRLRAKGANVIQAAVSGATQVAGAVTASTLTTVCVFLPIVFVEGITRQLFTDLALTMSFALLASLVVSLTLVPAMASGMLRKDRPIKEGLLEKKLLPLYAKAANWALRHKFIVLTASAAALVITAAASLSKGFIFMPPMDMPNVSVSVSMPEGYDMEQASAQADAVLARIEQIDGIATVGAMMDVGTSSLAGVSTTSYNITIYITLADETASGSAVGRQIEEACKDLPCTVSASSAMMDMSMLTGTGISMRVYADDMDDLQNAAKAAAAELEKIEGVKEVSNGLEDAAPALHVAIDRNKAMKHGLTVAQVYMELAAGLTADGTVASLELDGITTDVIIEKPEGAVLDAQELRDYTFEVTNKDGDIEEIPLTDFAVVEETSSLATINRISQRRYLTVTAYLEQGYNVTLVSAEAQAAIDNLDLGKGVSYTFSGENESIMEAVEQLALMLLLGVLLVYLVMVAQFQSLKSPFIVMFTIPLAFTGGFMALLIYGMEVSVVSMIGFIMLVGIIVNNGIVLVDYINQLRLEGMERREAIVEAGVTRMRPILMTTITTILGLIDMAVRKSAGTALMQPVAVVCIGGLIYATLMTLFVVPCIYDMLNKKELRNVREEDLKLLDI